MNKDMAFVDKVDSAVGALETAVKALQASNAVMRYARHIYNDCIFPGPCRCGLDEAMANSETLIKELKSRVE